jgi:hypothetical protein
MPKPSRLPRRADRRPRSRAAAGLEPAGGSVFIGGGTPSLMRAETAEALLAAIRMRLPLHPGAEITLEANPGTAEAAKFAAFRAAGVTRLSLGVQSFDDAKARRAGPHPRRRRGAARDRDGAAPFRARQPRPDVRAAGADPGAGGSRHRHRDRRSGVGHISAYHLTLEPNTAFHHAPPPLPDDDLAADMQEMVEDRLAGAGFGHYETSAFARGPDQRCRHNLNYWTFGDYLGIGAGAHGKLSNHERHLARGAPPPSARLPAARARRFHQHPAGRGPRRPARRIHDERPAPQRRLPAGAVHRAHRPAAGRHRKVGAGGTARGLLETVDGLLRAADCWRVFCRFLLPRVMAKRFLNRKSSILERLIWDRSSCTPEHCSPLGLPWGGYN